MLLLLGNVDSFVKSETSTARDVFLLLSVSWWVLEGFDDQSVGGRRSHFSVGLFVLNGQFRCRPQTFLITTCLGDVLTNLLGTRTQGAGLGGQGRQGTSFPTDAPQIHDFDLTEVDLRWHSGGGCCWRNPESGQLETAEPSPPPLS